MGMKLGLSLSLSLSHTHTHTHTHTKGKNRLTVSENNVLRTVFGPTREEVVRGCRRLHTAELHNMYTTPNIRVIKLRRMRWVGHVVCMGEMRNAYNILVENLKGRDRLKELGIVERIILECILWK
jgi:hypothetical protein